MISDCRLCPRECGVNREKEQTGYCRSYSTLKVARASLHMWEEPPICKDKGSGTVFFSGCNLRCVYCQNKEIALSQNGKTITKERLIDIFFELKEKGALNINLVTPSHYVYQIAECINLAKGQGFDLPFVYNTSAYEKAETLKILEGLIDIYMPDFKYWTKKTGKSYSNAPDYPEVAKMAIDEMVRQCHECIYDEKGVLKKGVIVRHMLIPKHVYDAKEIIKYLYSTYGEKIIYSIMSQYTPMAHFEAYPELNRRVTKKEYNSLLDFCIELGIENAYIQDLHSAKESFVPSFDNRGV